MIRFDNWTITAQAGVVARQYDNLTRRMEVLGELPEGWTWELLVQAQGHLDILLLTPCQGGVGIDLTEGMLALAGYYAMQLRGTRGEQVRHTNQVMVYIPESLSGSANWPTVPSEFAQVEQNILTLNANPPYPGDGGYWMTYDLEMGAYIQSDIPLPPVSEGPAGAAATVQVGTTTTGEPGTAAAVVNDGTENVAILNFSIPRGADGRPGEPGLDGTDGIDGGYYTPVVTQSGDTMQVSFSPSQASMPAVEAVQITLPSGGAYAAAVQEGFIGTEEEFNKILGFLTRSVYILNLSSFTPSEGGDRFTKTLTDDEYNHILLSARYGRPVSFDDVPYLFSPLVYIPETGINFLFQLDGAMHEISVDTRTNEAVFSFSEQRYMTVDPYLDFQELDTPIHDYTYAYENFSSGFPLLATYNGETIVLYPSYKGGGQYVYANIKYILILSDNGHTATLSLIHPEGT